MGASEKNGSENAEKFENNSILVKIEEDEHAKVNKKSKFIGLYYSKDISKWRAQRWSKDESKNVYNGCYDAEETAARASDTLARKLMENDKKKRKLNFPDDYTEVYRDQVTTQSKHIGVCYHKNNSKWYVQRWSQNDNKKFSNGYYDDEETAAHASDTLARQLMENGEKNLKLNFPDDYIEVYPDKKMTSKFIGVFYDKKNSKWCVQRRSKNENKVVSYGYYDDEETAAHASDTLARKLMENGKHTHKLNFPDDHTEVYPEN